MLNLKPFKQSHSHCGPACLKVILNYYGIDKTEKELGKLCKTDNVGTSGKELVQAAKKLGFDAKIKDKSSVKDIERYIKKEKIPIIIHWFSTFVDHYSVIADIDTENIYMMDPDYGQFIAKRIENLKYIWFGFNGDFPTNKRDFNIRRLIIIKPKKIKK